MPTATQIKILAALDAHDFYCACGAVTLADEERRLFENLFAMHGVRLGMSLDRNSRPTLPPRGS